VVVLESEVHPSATVHGLGPFNGGHYTKPSCHEVGKGV